jgi:predicted metal-dependent peptidase
MRIMPANAATPGWNDWAGMTHSTRATAALRALTEVDPALAALSLWCAHRDHDGATETAGTEIRYGPGFATLPLHEQIGVAGHHILHVALQHSARMADMAARLGAGFAPDLWGIAADAIVNEVLLAAGHALPRPALTLTGLLLATTGRALPPAEALAEWDVERLYLSLQGGAGGQGGAGQKARAHAAAQGHAPDLLPAPSDPQAGQTRADWRAHLTRAMAAGRAAGFGIGIAGQRLADLPQPRVPWERVLRRLLARATLPHPTPSHRRPARAWLAMEAEAREAGSLSPVFQPGLARARQVPRLVLGLDCSTSTEGPLLDLFLAEITGISRRMAAEVHVIPFDETAHPPVRLDLAEGAAAQIRALHLPQGGGTDFRPLIAAARRLAPSALIILTDLEGPCGPDPRLPVIWAVPDAATPPSAPFGHVLALSH